MTPKFELAQQFVSTIDTEINTALNTPGIQTERIREPGKYSFDRAYIAHRIALQRGLGPVDSLGYKGERAHAHALLHPLGYLVVRHASTEIRRVRTTVIDGSIILPDVVSTTRSLSVSDSREAISWLNALLSNDEPEPMPESLLTYSKDELDTIGSRKKSYLESVEFSRSELGISGPPTVQVRHANLM